MVGSSFTRLTKILLVALSSVFLLSKDTHAQDLTEAVQAHMTGAATYTLATYRKAPRSPKFGFWGHSKVARLSQPQSSGYIPLSAGGKGRPKAWCGWYMRQLKGGGPEFNTARNWVSYGRPASPGYGVVVVWPHHVGYIVGSDSRGWIVRSGNWNNRVADVPLRRMPSNIIAFRQG